MLVLSGKPTMAGAALYGQRTEVPRVVPSARASGARRWPDALSAAAAGDRGLLRRLDQLDPRVVGATDERDPRAVGDLDGALEHRAAERAQPGDVRVEVRRVEAEVLEPVVRHGVARSEALVGSRTRDVHGHA